GLSLHLNSIGCRECRPEYLKVLREYYSTRTDQLCPDCRARLERNPLRLLDCKVPTCQKIAESAPRSADHLCPACATHFGRLQKYLGLLSLPFAVNHRLVRGLDYYTRTVFEFQPEEEGAQSTVGGGGRYDGLIEELGGKPTPAVGFAAGIERIVLNLKRQGITVPPLPEPRVFIAYLGESANDQAAKLGAILRQAGIGVIQAVSGKSLKAQLRQANSVGARHVVIIGEQELQTGTVILRDMATAQQKTMPINELPGLL
ncbi:MAG: histidine--tRNA ligase, partial [Chloroflexi bacterium]|nr:histidine--tRNA ligase [Chloroflexota bacterium]